MFFTGIVSRVYNTVGGVICLASLPKNFGSNLVRRILSTILCWLVLSPQCFAYSNAIPVGYSKAEALQAAEILGVRTHLDRLLALQNDMAATGQQSEEAILLKSFLTRKILRGVLEVRQACNRLDLERAYTYDIMQKEERREQFIDALFNLAIFANLSTFYTMEPFARIHKQFAKSAIYTTTGGSIGATLTTASKIHGRYAKASHVAPPKILSDLIDGRPVDTTGLPPLVTKFLDSNNLSSSMSRREEIFALWKRSYHVDASKKENLFGIADKDKVSVRYLSSRILLLWSLHTFVQDFDRELLSLLKLVKGPSDSNSDSTKQLNDPEYTAGASEVVRLLKIRPQVEELIRLRRSNIENDRRDELEAFVLERTLEGNLEVQVASDKVDEELNYNYHIILAQLLERRARWLQYNYNLNFLQSSILGIVAGRLYLSREAFAGDQMFVISGGIGAGLTGLAIMLNHGGWRKVDTGPNSLAEVLNLHPGEAYRFSPFVSSFLNAPSPESTEGKSRREMLNEAWKVHHVTTMNLNRTKNQEALSGMPSHKYDTIKLVTNRVTLLHSLKKELESFQVEVLELLRATD